MGFFFFFDRRVFWRVFGVKSRVFGDRRIIFNGWVCWVDVLALGLVFGGRVDFFCFWRWFIWRVKIIGLSWWMKFLTVLKCWSFTFGSWFLRIRCWLLGRRSWRCWRSLFIWESWGFLFGFVYFFWWVKSDLFLFISFYVLCFVFIFECC